MRLSVRQVFILVSQTNDSIIRDFFCKIVAYKIDVNFGNIIIWNVIFRYGVAPDHPEVKNVINQFTKVAQQPNVHFYGNITLGRDIKISHLRQHYDAVLLVNIFF